MKKFLKHLKLFSMIVTFCYIIVVLINFHYGISYKGTLFLKQFASVFMYTFSIYLANTVVLNNYFSERGKIGNNFFKGLVLANVLTLFVIVILDVLGSVLLTSISFSNALSKIGTNYGTALFSMLITSLVYIVLVTRGKEKNVVREQKIIASKATVSFESLKNQLDPHFLFNSLNVLSALIEENPIKAQEFTIALSKIYRYVLDQKDKNLITVTEELNFAKLYVSLLKMRFENAINVDFPDDHVFENLKIVPLSLQLLLENAIKHNVISENRPLNIAIYFERNQLVVQNNLQKKKIFEKSNGIGLQNIIQRYHLVSNDLITIEELDTLYIVKLPLISDENEYSHHEEMVTSKLFHKAYDKMHRLKEFYVTIWITLIAIPIFYLANNFYLPQIKWFYAIVVCMLIALFINGVKMINLFGNWEQK